MKNKIKNSYLFRTLVFILCMAMLFSLVGTIAGTYFLYDQNLTNAAQGLIEKKLMYYVAYNETPDIQAYNNLMLTADETYESYYEGEIEIFENKYSRENTNIVFTVTTPDGTVLLKNGDIGNDALYTYHFSIFCNPVTPPYEYEEDSAATTYESEEYGATIEEEFTTMNVETAEIEDEGECSSPYADLTISVKDDLQVKDLYYYAARMARVISFIAEHSVFIIVLSAILLLAAVILLLCLCGYDRNGERKAGGIHRFPLDLLLLLNAAMCFILYYEAEMWFVAIGIIVIEIIPLLETVTVRIKARRFLRNNLFWQIGILLKKAARIIAKNKNMFFKALLVFIPVTLFEGLMFIWFHDEPEILSVFFILLKLLEAVAIAYLLVMLKRIQQGAEKISNGDFENTIDTNGMFGEIKRNADYLNSITDSISTEVKKRLKSESMKTELITNVSHDLKTPLTSIINYIDLLKKTDVKDEKATEYIEVIDRQSQKLKKLTTDIVEASKSATGNIEVNIAPTDLNVLLIQTAGEYEEKLNAKGLSLETDLPESSIIVPADGRLLWRVADNLLNNICKYSMPGTRVYLSLKRAENRTEITFRNISSEKLNISPDELTERFVRGDESRGKTDGSGLGLSIAKSLTELMNADFRIEIDGDLFKAIITFNE